MQSETTEVKTLEKSKMEPKRQKKKKKKSREALN